MCAKMDVAHFLKVNSLRKKLNVEIAEAEAIVEQEGAVYLIETLQANIFCIAALLRGILEYLPSMRDQYTVEVLEISLPDLIRDTGRKRVPLYFLAERMLHYVEYVPYWENVASVSEIKTISIISDRDRKKGIEGRTVDLPEFFGIAKQLIDDLQEVLEVNHKRIGKEHAEVERQALEHFEKISKQSL